ncbi:hypothetical protein GPECTOR_67g282 [Gonium pectorale]|uniref:60S ribosomal export protein NMD3 n=1 Tax=Gonium pectorale TaxID=33097 RepID=A0A150G3I5_GONPE|nr:hypothetical protein GPECTOR_67g282 [Gonium pectorale]|eukprot:KXZ44442.1 hypothetical protein GPECTOR_67g282 [Gonium pectorale]
MCVNCIRSQVDITEGIQKQVTVLWCKECGRYLQPPKHWVSAELESKELLTFCIKKIKGLQKVKLVDAGFIWTEPHSKRLKIKLTIQDDLVCLPPKMAASCGNLGPLVLVSRITNQITITDPQTLRSTSMDAPVYYRHAFTALASQRALVPYIVLDVEPLQGGQTGTRYSLAEAQIPLDELLDDLELLDIGGVGGANDGGDGGAGDMETD